MTFHDIKCSDRARIGHQMLHLSRAPNRVKSPYARMIRLALAAPQRIIEAVAGHNDGKWQWFVIARSFPEGGEQLRPPLLAW